MGVEESQTREDGIPGIRLSRRNGIKARAGFSAGRPSPREQEWGHSPYRKLGFDLRVRASLPREQRRIRSGRLEMLRPICRLHNLLQRRRLQRADWVSQSAASHAESPSCAPFWPAARIADGLVRFRAMR
jgi:hypothetical protein